MEFKHQMIGTTLLYKYHDPVFNEVGIINYKRNLAILLDKYPVEDIILDVENTKIVDNNGLSAIMFARRFTNANGHKCVLGMPRPKLLSLLKTAKLTEVFTIIQRKEEYQAYLKTLVEKAEKERVAREAEKAKKTEEMRKQREEARKQEAKSQDKNTVEEKPQNGNGIIKKKSRRKPVKKPE